MRHQIQLPKRAQKDLDRVDVRYRTRIITGLIALSSDPHLGKKLHGKYKHERSYEIWPYRIVYHITKSAIVIIRIGHRQGV